MSGISEPFLLQDVRYHCPIYVIFIFDKPVFKTFLREIWLYNQGDFTSVRQRVTVKSQHNIINKYASNFTNTLINLAKDCNFGYKMQMTFLHQNTMVVHRKSFDSNTY